MEYLKKKIEIWNNAKNNFQNITSLLKNKIFLICWWIYWASELIHYYLKKINYYNKERDNFEILLYPFVAFIAWILIKISVELEKEKNIKLLNELITRNNQIQQIIDNLPFPIRFKDNMWKYIIVNNCFAVLFWLEINDILWKTDEQLKNINTTSIVKIFEEINKNILDKIFIVPKNWFWYEGQVKSVEDTNWIIIWQTWFLRDLSKCKKVEELLQESILKFDSLLNSTQDIVIYKDIDGNYIHANSAFLSVIWKKLEEIKWKNDKTIFTKEKSECFMQYDKEVVLNKCSIRYEKECTNTNWQNLFFEIIKSPVLSQDWKVIWIICIARNITETKEMQEKIKNNNEFLQEIIDKIPVPIFLKNTQWEYILINKSFSEMIWKPNSEILWKTIYDIFPKNTTDYIDEKDKWILFNQWTISYEIETSLLWTNYVKTYLLTKTIIIKWNNIIWTLWVFHDITEDKRIQQIKDDVHRMTIHDIKWLLWRIIWGPEILIEELKYIGELDPNILEIIQTIKRTWERMAILINTLNEIKRIEEWKFEFMPEMVNIVEIFNCIFQDLKIYMKEKNIAFSIKYKWKSTWNNYIFYINWHQQLLYELFLNLTKNAIEASKQNWNIEINIDEKENSIIIWINNDWIIPTQMREKFFDKYQTFWKKRWTWLWTYIAKIITQAHKWKITFSTSEDNWTTIFVEIPK